jgi:hypothetical protein
MSTRVVLLFVLLAMVLCCAACPGGGSSAPPGERTLITGVVKDARGSALKNAAVLAVKPGSNFSASTNTDSNGEYVLQVQTGSYHVTASLDRYMPGSREVSLSEAGDQAKVDFQLRAKP